MRPIVVWVCFVAVLGLWGFAFASGAEVYLSKCAPCHGPKGEGTPTGPAMKGSDFNKTVTPADLTALILNGRGGTAKKYLNIPIDMPGGLVSKAEAEQLATFLKGELQK